MYMYRMLYYVIIIRRLYVQDVIDVVGGFRFRGQELGRVGGVSNYEFFLGVDVFRYY